MTKPIPISSTTSNAMPTQHHQQYLVQRIPPHASYEALLEYPAFFEIETVHACNAKCVMCSAFQDKRPQGVMAQPLFEKIAADIATHADKVQRVNLFRDGEPFLDPHLEERTALLKELGVRCVSVTSNMSLASPERAEKLLRAGLDQIDISIDGFTAATFESIRRGLKYERVLENTLNFINIRDQLRSPCKIRVRMVLQQANEAEWAPFSLYWSGVLSAQDTVMNHPIHNWGNQLKDFVPVRETPLVSAPCVALWSLLPIFSDGTVPLCNVDSAARHALGHVSRQSITEIWQGEVASRMRRLHLHGDRDDVEMCRGCNVWDTPNYFQQA